MKKELTEEELKKEVLDLLSKFDMEEDDLINMAQLCQVVLLNHLQTVLSINNYNKESIFSAIGEICGNGCDYQIQLVCVANKDFWMNEDGIRFSGDVIILDDDNIN